MTTPFHCPHVLLNPISDLVPLTYSDQSLLAEEEIQRDGLEHTIALAGVENEFVTEVKGHSTSML